MRKLLLHKSTGWALNIALWLTLLWGILILLLAFSAQSQTTMNVTSYGAVGDEIDTTATTTSNSTVIVIGTNLPNSYVGDAVEIANGGVYVTGNNSYGVATNGNHDFISYIASISGTSVTMDSACSNTMTGAFCSIGHNNTTNLNNVIQLADAYAATNHTTIYLPTGRYLTLSGYNGLYQYCALLICSGNITFTGDGTNATVLINQFASTEQAYNGQRDRGYEFEEVTPVTNNIGPVILQNMQFSSGLQFGNFTNGIAQFHQGPFVNWVDGYGWDGTEKLWLVWGVNPLVNELNEVDWTNDFIRGWRGEVLISLNNSTNGFLKIVNSSIYDCNASFINQYSGLAVSNNIIDTVFKPFEYISGYSTNKGIFAWNIITNMNGTGPTWDDTALNAPVFSFFSNSIYGLGLGSQDVVFMAGPATDIQFYGNYLSVPANWTGINIGGDNGWITNYDTGDYDTSNIMVFNNTFALNSGSTAVELNGWNASNGDGPWDGAEDIAIYSNTATSSTYQANFIVQYNALTNTFATNNNLSSIYNVINVHGGNAYQYTFIGTNNTYWTQEQIGAVVTNAVSYATGPNYQLSSCANGAALILGNSDAANIPAGAQMVINNQNSFTMPIFLNTLSGTQINLANNQLVVANFFNGSWTTNGTAGGVFNVTNYGAVGDAVQFWVNTTSNSTTVVSDTNTLTSAAIGDAIEITGAGLPVVGTNSFRVYTNNNQDYVGYITAINQGTNITVSPPCSNTLVNAFATYGHDNETNFQNTETAAQAQVPATINIPTGQFLCLANQIDPSATNYVSVFVTSGGITWNGAGTNLTRIIGQFASIIRPTLIYYPTPTATNAPWRGILFEENGPSLTQFSNVWQNMTIDGGLWVANISNSAPYHNFPVNPVDRIGWDWTHDAFVNWNIYGAQVVVSETYSNILFDHWAGEVQKSIDYSTNGTSFFYNDTWSDDNADCVNKQTSLAVSNNVFNGVYECLEAYEGYMLYPGYFGFNTCTNINGTALALTTSAGKMPAFGIITNTISYTMNNGNAVVLTSGRNITFQGNTCLQSNYNTFVAIGLQSGGTSFDNSNILVTGNTFMNPSVVVGNYGGTGPTDPQRGESITVSGNNLLTNYIGSFTSYLFVNNGWATNVTITGNTATNFNNLANSVILFPSSYSTCPYPLVPTNNIYYTKTTSATITTNAISYGTGSRYYDSGSVNGAVYLVQNTDSNQIPAGAQILFNNQDAFTVPVLLNNTNGNRVLVSSGSQVLLNFLGGIWSTNGAAQLPIMYINNLIIIN